MEASEISSSFQQLKFDFLAHFYSHEPQTTQLLTTMQIKRQQKK